MPEMKLPDAGITFESILYVVALLVDDSYRLFKLCRHIDSFYSSSTDGPKLTRRRVYPFELSRP